MSSIKQQKALARRKEAIDAKSRGDFELAFLLLDSAETLEAQAQKGVPAWAAALQTKAIDTVL